ncbi:MAG TPA: copper-binding protein, partial [Verrucomicrobiae bacterium]|nr:copper-binding protein [Verrucomicrobiae bacterium]
MMFWRRFLLLVLAIAGPMVLFSCKEQTSSAAESSPAGRTNQQFYQVKGVVKELKPDGKTVVIRHEEVPHYMPAMTMPFEVRDTNELRGLRPGDLISFQLVVTPDNGWIEHVTKLSAARTTELPSRPTFRLVRDVDPLQVGDALPNYHFTNELGQAVSTKQLKGQAFAFTF